MKRASILIDYPSSDEGSSASPPQIQTTAEPPAKKRKPTLPSLPAHLLPQTPVDNPALHQGRRRTVPHVQGQYAAHVYVPLFIPKRTKLCDLLRRVFRTAKELVPSLHPIGLSDAETAGSDSVTPSASAESVSPDDSLELHISLTRPIYLCAHQHEDFKRAVHSIARQRQKFTASFTTLSELINDERTRSFLTLEIGAGHDELKSMIEGLSPTLRSIRQKEFYESPRFHASIAWALLDNSQSALSPSSSSSSQSSVQPIATPAPSERSQASSSSSTSSDAISFPTIPSFPASLIPHLRAEFDRELVKPIVGFFEVEEIHVRIGREVSRWRFCCS